MRFGLNLLNFGAGVRPESIDAWARLSEDAGFSFLTISDHVAITEDVFAEYPTPFYDPLTVLAFLAARTNRVRIGTSVLVAPYRHPLLTARMVANIDQLSGGRVFLGVGVGWAEQEFAAIGVPFRSRGRITDEYLDVMRQAWSEGKVSREGEFVSFRDVYTEPLPASADGIPIWIGGESAPAIRRVVARGDAWHPIRPAPGWLGDVGLAALAREAEGAGVISPPVIPRILLDIRGSRLPNESRVVGQGSLDQIRSDLEGLMELGIEDVLLDTYDETVVGSANRQEPHLELIEQFVAKIADPRSGALR